MRTRSLRALLYFGAGFGLIVSLFAAAEFYDATLTRACSFTSFFSCGKIANSGLTTTLGIQDWIWGVAGFVVILALAVLAERQSRDSRLAYLLLLVTTGGVVISLYFLYVELVEINGLCPVCVTAYLFGGVAWLGAIGLARRAYRRDRRLAPTGSPPSG